MLYSPAWRPADITATYSSPPAIIRICTPGVLHGRYGGNRQAAAPVWSEAGSHSVGHQDFASFEIGVPGNTRDNYFPSYIARWESTGATVYGECSFQANPRKRYGFASPLRSGHLKVPKYLINVLDELGYRYDSSQSANDL